MWVSGKVAREFVHVRVGVLTDSMPSGASVGKVCVSIRKSASNDATGLVAVCCSVLQYVAVCDSVWQCVAVCCSVVQCVRRIKSCKRAYVCITSYDSMGCLLECNPTS